MSNSKYSDKVIKMAYNNLKKEYEDKVAEIKNNIEMIEAELCRREMIDDLSFILTEKAPSYERTEIELEAMIRDLQNQLKEPENRITKIKEVLKTHWEIEDN